MDSPNGVRWCVNIFPLESKQTPLNQPMICAWHVSTFLMKSDEPLLIFGLKKRSHKEIPPGSPTFRRTFGPWSSLLVNTPVSVGIDILAVCSCVFPTCQVRVVRFYVSCLVLLLLLSSPPPLVVLLVLLLNCDSRSTVFSVGPQPRPSPPSVPCRTSTTTIPAQCSLPDLNHDHPRPVFPAGPQPRVSPPSVPCRTSTTTIHAQCSLPDLNREYPRQKICHIECQKICQIEC